MEKKPNNQNIIDGTIYEQIGAVLDKGSAIFKETDDPDFPKNAVQEIINELDYFKFPFLEKDICKGDDKKKYEKAIKNGYRLIRQNSFFTNGNKQFVELFSLKDGTMQYLYDYITDNFLITVEELNRNFKKGISENAFKSFNYESEINAYKPFLALINPKSTKFKYDNDFIEIRVTKDFSRFDWKHRFLLGFSSILHKKQLEHFPNYDLLDLYFINLGTVHAEHFINIKNEFENMDAIKKDASLPEKILLLDELGIIDLLKQKLNIEGNAAKKLVDVLAFLLDGKPDTIKSITTNISPNRNEYPSKNTPKTPKNYDTIITLLSDKISKDSMIELMNKRDALAPKIEK